MVNSPLIRLYLLGGVALGGVPWVPMNISFFPHLSTQCVTPSSNILKPIYTSVGVSKSKNDFRAVPNMEGKKKTPCKRVSFLKNTPRVCPGNFRPTNVQTSIHPGPRALPILDGMLQKVSVDFGRLKFSRRWNLVS